jgi:hypothetical protein
MKVFQEVVPGHIRLQKPVAHSEAVLIFELIVHIHLH